MVWLISPPTAHDPGRRSQWTIIRGALSGSANKLVLSEVEAIIYQRSQWEGQGGPSLSDGPGIGWPRTDLACGLSQSIFPISAESPSGEFFFLPRKYGLKSWVHGLYSCSKFWNFKNVVSTNEGWLEESKNLSPYSNAFSKTKQISCFTYFVCIIFP